MTGTRTGALAVALALALAGCGGGGNAGIDTAARQAPGSTTPATSGSTSTGASTTTSAPSKKKTQQTAAQKKPAAKKPAPAEKPALIRKAERRLRNQRRAAIELAALCPKPPANLPRPPDNPEQMPRYARAVLPIAKRNATKLRGARTPGAVPAARALAQGYDTLVPLLTQVAAGSTSKDQVKALSKTTARLVVAMHGAAIAAGAPHCGLPA